MNRKYLMLPILYVGTLHADLGPIRFGGLTNDIIDQTTISASGNYRLARSLAVSSGVAITITTSNVALDLDNFEIVGAGAGTTGIFINANLENITVQNGTIDNFDIGISLQDSTTNINLLDLDLVRCGPTAGIEFNGPPLSGEPTISQILIKNTNIFFSDFGTGGVGGIACNISGCKDLQMVQCQINDNTLGTSTIPLTNCRKCLINNLQINNNVIENPISEITWQLISLVNNSIECTIENCKIMNNEGSNSGAAIATDMTSSDNYINNCLVDGNTTTAAFTSYRIFSPNNLVENCNASNNTGTAAMARGFYFLGTSNNTIIDCIAHNNTSIENRAFGFDFENTFSCRAIRCLALDTFSAPGLSSIGFRIQSGGADVGNEVTECQALGNDIGFSRIDAAANDAFFKNISTQNRVSQYDAGFPAGSFQLAANLAAINASLTIPWTNVGIGT